MSGVRFCVPEIHVDVREEDVGRILHELALIDRPYRRYFASGATARLLEASNADGRIDLARWTPAEVWALCRALDHVHNLEQRDGASPPPPSTLWLLRGSVLSYSGLPSCVYELALVVPDGKERKLRSHSGVYAPGDRCAHGGEAFTVVTVQPGFEHERLICEVDFH